MDDLHDLPTPQSKPRKPLPLIVLAVAIALAGLGAAWWFAQSQKPPAAHPEAERFRRIEEPRVALAEAFRSYDDEESVSGPLEAAGLTVRREVVERPESDRYPPRRLASFTIEGYRHLDETGTLVLEFFNRRLMEVDFRPDDPARYAPRLHRRYPALTRDRIGYVEWAEGDARIWASVDLAKSKVGRTLGTEGTVLWQDLRLIRQRDDWDARFGHIPPPAPK